MRLSAEIVNAKSFDCETLIAMTAKTIQRSIKRYTWRRKHDFSYLIQREAWTSKQCSNPHPQWKFLSSSDHIYGEQRYRSHKRIEDTDSYPVLPKSMHDFDFDDRDVKTL